MDLIKIGKNSFLFIFLPFLASIILLLILEGPSYNGTITISYNLNPISIKRDEYGIPTIESHTLKDVSYGLGFVHAQDRLWTVHFRKLLFSGQLSQAFGNSTLSLDLFMRSVSLERYSRYSLEYMKPELVDLIQAYVDGFNEAVKNMKVLPLEFWFTRTYYQPLEIIDVVTIAKGISFFLAYGYQSETIYATLENILGIEKVREIIPREEELLLWNNITVLNDDELKQSNIFEPFNENKRFETPKGQVIPDERLPPDSSKPTHLPPVEAYLNIGQQGSTAPHREHISEEINRLAQPSEVAGSNAWVIHGNHTSTGKPIIANDPHLANGIPSFWYNAVLVYEDEYITGMSVAGLPMIMIGKTKHVAWGFTANLMDGGDLYNVTIRDDKYYLYEGNWYPLKENLELIRIKGDGKILPHTVYETHHGVIIDPYFLSFFSKKGYKIEDPNERYALAWMGYLKNDTTLNSFYDLFSVKTAEEMIGIWEGSAMFGMNIHFATTTGDIGYLLLGRIPIRRSVETGGKPLDGSKAENDWVGWIPWEDQPRIINPAKGYIISANNKIATNNLKWHVSTTMLYTSRAARIQEMIAEKIDSGNKISIEDVKIMQLDTVDILAREVVPVIIKCTYEALKIGYKTSDIGLSRINEILKELKEWDYNMDKESVAATLFSVWEVSFYSKILHGHKMTEEARITVTEENAFTNFVYKKVLAWNSLDKTLFDEYWCRNEENTNEEHPCLYNLAKSIEDTWTFLEQKIGRSLSDWKWGKLHKEEYPHSPLSQTILKRLFDRSISTSGNDRTVKISKMKQTKAGYNGVWSPNMRMIMSVGEKNNSYAIIDTGISGRPQARHYDDQMIAYHDGKWLTMGEGRREEWKDKLDLDFKL